MEKEELIKNIGEELFNQLKPEDQELMLNTAGSIDFGYPVDLDIEKTILRGFLSVVIQKVEKEARERWGNYGGYAGLYVIEDLFVKNPKLQYWKSNERS